MPEEPLPPGHGSEGGGRPLKSKTQPASTAAFRLFYYFVKTRLRAPFHSAAEESKCEQSAAHK
jgi:hypothetical protein